MNDAFLPWFLVVLVCIAPILLLPRGSLRRDQNGADTGSWASGPDGDSGGGDGGGGGSD
jgi:uncharacterized membrane protein YgcG